MGTSPTAAAGQDLEAEQARHDRYRAAGRRLVQASAVAGVLLAMTVVTFVLAIAINSAFRRPVMVVVAGLGIADGVAVVAIFVALARHMIHAPHRQGSTRPTASGIRGAVGPRRTLALLGVVLIAGTTFIAVGAVALPRYLMGGPTAHAAVIHTDLETSCDARGNCDVVRSVTYATPSGLVRTRTVGAALQGTPVIYSVRHPQRAMAPAAYRAAPGRLLVAVVAAAVAAAALALLTALARRAGQITEVRPGVPIRRIRYGGRNANWAVIFADGTRQNYANSQAVRNELIARLDGATLSRGARRVLVQQGLPPRHALVPEIKDEQRLPVQRARWRVR